MTRVYPDETGELPPMSPGDYGHDTDGHWWAVPPESGMPMGRLDAHDIVEHEDGTITASPSILVTGQHGRQWHGYLEHGVWRSV